MRRYHRGSLGIAIPTVMRCDVRSLEFDQIRRVLERLTFTPYGAEAARDLVPAPDVEAAQAMQRAVSAARFLIESGLAKRGPAPHDVRAALRQAASPNAALSAPALRHVAENIALARTLHGLAAREPNLVSDATALLAPEPLVATLAKHVSPAGRLVTEADAELARLSEEVAANRIGVETKLRARLASLGTDQPREQTSSIRWIGARGILAVRAEHEPQLKGVRRGSEAGGRIVLFEPGEVAADNNRLDLLELKSEARAHEVLKQLTAKLRPHVPALLAMIESVAWIDLALAAGAMSSTMNATAPKLAPEPRVVLDRAYHPYLLWQLAQGEIARVVPLSIALDAAHPLMIVTGPNTGGKTVMLRTIGLLVAMAHCGLHVPAEGECTIGTFGALVLSVGDRQSLLHQLSTFAAHVEMLKSMLAEADGATLVLLDELGTGTDPDEGAALAMAVLEELERRGTLGVVTTHLPRLKAFAASHPGVVNASMRFDDERLEPAYQLVVGTPGRSLGLLVAERRGMPGDIVTRARMLLEERG